MDTNKKPSLGDRYSDWAVIVVTLVAVLLGWLLVERYHAAYADSEASKLELEARLNWVIGRVTGKGTTVDKNPYSEMPNYATFGAALGYRRLLPGIDLQLSVENLLDNADTALYQAKTKGKNRVEAFSNPTDREA